MSTRYGSALVFLAIIVAGGGVLLRPAMQEGILLSWTLLIAELSEKGLRTLGFEVARESRALLAPGGSFAMRIDNDCNGAWAHLIFLASVAAYPATWRERLIGLTIGEALLFFLNVLRIMSLFLLGVYVPVVFRAAHVYVWQFLIIALALLLFLVWADRFVRRSP